MKWMAKPKLNHKQFSILLQWLCIMDDNFEKGWESYKVQTEHHYYFVLKCKRLNFSADRDGVPLPEDLFVKLDEAIYSCRKDWIQPKRRKCFVFKTFMLTDLLLECVRNKFKFIIMGSWLVPFFSKKIKLFAEKKNTFRRCKWWSWRSKSSRKLCSSHSSNWVSKEKDTIRY
jgi:hypothetical protein